jgi:hypothetical protein
VTEDPNMLQKLFRLLRLTGLRLRISWLRHQVERATDWMEQAQIRSDWEVSDAYLALRRELLLDLRASETILASMGERTAL